MHDDDEDDDICSTSDPLAQKRYEEAEESRLTKILIKLGFEEDEIKSLFPTLKDKQAAVKEATQLCADQTVPDAESDADTDPDDDGELSEIDARAAKILDAAKKARKDRKQASKNSSKKQIQKLDDETIEELNKGLPESDKVSWEEIQKAMEALDE
jgi:hypothetical protein